MAIELPLGYKLEAAPDTVTLETDFSKYQISYQYKNNTLYYKRHFKFRMRSIDPKYYDEFKPFIRQVVKSDQTAFIFKKR